MANTIIIGSSNMYRPWDIMKEEDKRCLTLQRCTKIEGFRALMSELIEDDKRVIISVIENFVCDAVSSIKKKDIEEKVNICYNTGSKYRVTQVINISSNMKLKSSIIIALATLQSL